MFDDTFHLSFASTTITNYLRKQVTTGQNPVNETNFYTYIDDFVEIFTELDLQVEAPLTLNRGVIGIDTDELPAAPVPEGTVIFHGNVMDADTYAAMILPGFGNNGDEFYVPTAMGMGINPFTAGMGGAATLLDASGLTTRPYPTWYRLISNTLNFVIHTDTLTSAIFNPATNAVLAIGDSVYFADGTEATVNLAAIPDTPTFFTDEQDFRVTLPNLPTTVATDAPNDAMEGLADIFGSGPGDMLFSARVEAQVGLYKKVNDNWTLTNTTYTTL